MNTICIKIVDITSLSTDAIVNAANDALHMGGGVCGAIFKAAGPTELKKECSKYNGCPTGSAVITSGCNLKAKYIIHAVGPIWHGGNHTPQTVAEAYKELLVDQGYAKYFKKVVFAIIGDQNDKFGNYDVFQRVLGTNHHNIEA